MTSKSDELIYKNSNTYRLHADNLRWTLLGGYAVFLTAIVGFSHPPTNSLSISDPKISFLAFILSFSYLWILAIQNWFYNLFARWVQDCESCIIEKRPLRSLKTFADSIGPSVSPYHPSFFLSQLLVGSVAYYFLTITLKNANFPWLTQPILSLESWLVFVIWLVGLIIYFAILNVFFLNWQEWVYEPIIMRLSNLYKPLDKEIDVKLN